MTRPYYYIRKIATMANKQKRCRIPIIVLPGGQGVVIKKKMLVCLQEGWVSSFVNVLTLVMILGLQTQKNTNSRRRIGLISGKPTVGVIRKIPDGPRGFDKTNRKVYVIYIKQRVGR